MAIPCTLLYVVALVIRTQFTNLCQEFAGLRANGRGLNESSKVKLMCKPQPPQLARPANSLSLRSNQVRDLISGISCGKL